MFNHLMFCINDGSSSSLYQPLLVQTVRMWTRASVASLAIGLGNIRDHHMKLFSLSTLIIFVDFSSEIFVISKHTIKPPLPLTSALDLCLLMDVAHHGKHMKPISNIFLFSIPKCCQCWHIGRWNRDNCRWWGLCCHGLRRSLLWRLYWWRLCLVCYCGRWQWFLHVLGILWIWINWFGHLCSHGVWRSLLRRLYRGEYEWLVSRFEFSIWIHIVPKSLVLK